METTSTGPVSIHYRRGIVLAGAWLGLGLTTAFVIAYIGFTVQFVPENPGAIIGVWAVLILVLLAVAAAAIPLIRRVSSNDPAITISSEGIKTRDMDTLLPWDEIEMLRTRNVTSWAGKYTTTVNMFEICPTEPAPSSFNWRQFVDGHANPLRVAWHLLAGPERLSVALDAHAPPDLMAKSELPGLPRPSRKPGV